MVTRLVKQLRKSEFDLNCEILQSAVEYDGFCDEPDCIITIVSDDPEGQEVKPIGADVYLETYKHCGKENWWKVVGFVFDVERIRYIGNPDKTDYFFLLPDDVEVEPDFYSKAIEAFDRIQDPNKVCLNLLSDGRTGTSQWTDHEVTWNEDYNAYNTGWVDCCFVANSSMLETLGHEVLPIKGPRDKWASTGVGRQISQRLLNAGKTMWQCKEGFVRHGDHPSLLHPEINPKARDIFT